MRKSPTILLTSKLALVMCACSADDSPPMSVGSDTLKPVAGFVSSAQHFATQAGVEALRKGGNAIDAAVATALTLGVVDGHNSGIGGGCFMLIRLADGTLIALDGRETAPARASRDMYLVEGQLNEELSKTGPLAIAVPGALAVYDWAVKNLGRLTLADALEHGIRLADEGFPIDGVYARKLERTAADIARFPASAAIFLKDDGRPLKEGEILVQKDLAASYRALAQQGVDWFYKGQFARKLEDYMSENGGIMTADDLASYEFRKREPLITSFLDWTIIGFPPPSSGGVHVAQILNILENFALRDFDNESPEFIHLVVEAMKLAFADRAHWLGDPAFTQVPVGLLDKEYARELAARIDLQKSTLVPTHGLPPKWQTDHFSKHTTHLATADEFGNWVALTATINTAFGSKVIIPGTGILMNNEMDDFSIAPGVPNHFGLVGGEANAIAPGKRPLSSMSPTIVLHNGEPVFSAGAAGGPTIITQTVLSLLRCLVFGKTPEEALAAPRFHHQWSPDRIRIERAFPEETLRRLREMGHDLQVQENFGSSQLIQKTAQGFRGASDPRSHGAALPAP